MSSDKNQVEAMRCIRLVQSIYDLERSNARDWEWIAAQLQRIVDMPNHLKHRRPIFFELKQLLEKEYITMGKGVVADIKPMTSSPCILGVALNSDTRKQELLNLFGMLPSDIEYVTPDVLVKIKVKEIETPLRTLALIPDAPGSYHARINKLTMFLATSLAHELVENYAIHEQWIEYFSDYFTKLLRYTIVYGIYHEGPREASDLFEFINDPSYKDHASGINIPLGYISPRRLLVLCESDQTTS